MPKSKSAIVFDIQRFSIHDGPGIRTAIFFKGCSLRCSWCQNPEGIKEKPEIAFYQERCLSCLKCISVCPRNAISDNLDQKINWQRCDHCGLCVDVCPSTALSLVGQTYSPRELRNLVLRDKEFYQRSSGGITLTGGEAVLQNNFLLEFLPLVKEKNIHILLETAGQYAWSRMENLLEFIDYIYYDIKLAREHLFKKHTGGNLKQITKNLEHLLKKSFPLTIRLPVVPGINTSREEIKKIAELLKGLQIKKIMLLKYNHLWEAKIPRLNTQQNKLGIQAPIDNMDLIRNQLLEFGIDTNY